MTPAEAAKAVNDTFGKAGILRASPEILAALALPAGSKEFLLTGGFPGGRVFAFDFALVGTLPTVSDYAAEHGYLPVEDDLTDALCLGDSWGGILIVLKPMAWNVITIDLTGVQDDMFVNTDVASLGASLAAYASLVSLRETLEPAKLSAHLERTLMQIDAPCVESWWSTVIQEVEFGMS